MSRKNGGYYKRSCAFAQIKQLWNMKYFYLTQRSVIHKENVNELINNLCNKRLLVTFFLNAQLWHNCKFYIYDNFWPRQQKNQENQLYLRIFQRSQQRCRMKTFLTRSFFFYLKERNWWAAYTVRSFFVSCLFVVSSARENK